MDTKTVHRTTSVDGDVSYRIEDYSPDSYHGELIDTMYLDGADYTWWNIFVGTLEECQEYIKKHTTE